MEATDGGGENREQRSREREDRRQQRRLSRRNTVTSRPLKIGSVRSRNRVRSLSLSKQGPEGGRERKRDLSHIGGLEDVLNQHRDHAIDRLLRVLRRGRGRLQLRQKMPRGRNVARREVAQVHVRVPRHARSFLYRHQTGYGGDVGGGECVCVCVCV